MAGHSRGGSQASQHSEVVLLGLKPMEPKADWPDRLPLNNDEILSATKQPGWIHWLSRGVANAGHEHNAELQKMSDTIATMHNEREALRAHAGHVELRLAATETLLEEVKKQAGFDDKGKQKKKEHFGDEGEDADASMDFNDDDDLEPSGKSRSPKHPDPEPWAGNPKTLEKWKMQMFLKLHINSDHWSSEKKKIAYVISRLDGDAVDQVSSHINGEKIDIESVTALFKLLTDSVGDPDPVGTAQTKLRNIRQGARTFADYYAEFCRYSTKSKYGSLALKSALNEGLSDELQRMRVLLDIDDLSVAETAKKYLSIDNKMRNSATILAGRRGQKVTAALRSNFSPFNIGTPLTPVSPNVSAQSTGSTTPVSSTANSINSGASFRPGGLEPMDTSTMTTGTRPRPVKGAKLTDEERQYRRVNNLCFYCGTKGHTTNFCPHKPGKTVTVRTGEVTEDLLVDTEN